MADGKEYVTDDEEVPIATSTVSDRKKYLLLKVPDFATDPVDSTRSMTSYLRIGAYATDWENEPGADLEKIVHAAGTPGGRVERNGVKVLPPHPNEEDARLMWGWRGSDGKVHPSTEEPPSTEPDPEQIFVVYDAAAPNKFREATAADLQNFPAFVDDKRIRDIPLDRLPADEQDQTRADGHELSLAERKTHSGLLHTRGGWRDHSDGNRITTTWGDKVEVIRGNYKMIVLGRQDDPGNATGWDVSGQHIQDLGATMPGASVRVEWVRDEKHNAWHLLNTTEGVIQTDTSGGNFYDYKWGEVSQSVTGTPKPFVKATNDTLKARIETYVADEVAKGVGAEAALSKIGETLRGEGYDLDYALEMKKNPHIIERTWATRIEGYTGSSALRIPSTYEETWVDEAEEKSDVNTSTSTSRVGTQTDTATVDILTETSTVGVQTSTNTVGVLTETTTVGTHVNTTFATAVVDTTFVGAKNETTIGAIQSEISVAEVKSGIDLAAYVFELVFTGAKLGVTIGLEQAYKIGEFNEVSIPDKKEIALKKLKLSLSETRSTLRSQSASVQSKNLAMSQSLTALQVFLGT